MNQDLNSRSVLMLCETFPPESDVGGLRGAMFCKYLPKYGWTPIVFSRIRPEGDPDHRPSMEIEGLPKTLDQISFIFGRKDEEEALQKRTYFGLFSDFLMPDMAHPPGLVARWLIASKKVLTNKSFNAVWGSAPSLGCLTMAAKIASGFNVPWIADFRDISEQQDFETLREKLLCMRIIYRRRQIVRSAAAVVTVSEHLAKVLETSTGRSVHVIRNGFDPKVFPPLSQDRFEKFSIVYVGRVLNEWLRNPRPFFEGVDLLLKASKIAKDDLDIVFYGTEPSIIKEMLSPYNCRRLVRIMPTVPYKEVPGILQGSSILLLLTNYGKNGIMTTKVFEYIAAKRPILCAPCDSGELGTLLSETNSGVSCRTGEEIATILKKWYEEWKSTGIVMCKSNGEKIMQYSRETQAGQLAKLLDSTCIKRG